MKFKVKKTSILQIEWGPIKTHFWRNLTSQRLTQLLPRSLVKKNHMIKILMMKVKRDRAAMNLLVRGRVKTSAWLSSQMTMLRISWGLFKETLLTCPIRMMLKKENSHWSDCTRFSYFLKTRHQIVYTKSFSLRFKNLSSKDCLTRLKRAENWLALLSKSFSHG